MKREVAGAVHHRGRGILAEYVRFNRAMAIFTPFFIFV